MRALILVERLDQTLAKKLWQRLQCFGHKIARIEMPQASNAFRNWYRYVRSQVEGGA